MSHVEQENAQETDMQYRDVLRWDRAIHDIDIEYWIWQKKFLDKLIQTIRCFHGVLSKLF